VPKILVVCRDVKYCDKLLVYFEPYPEFQLCLTENEGIATVERAIQIKPELIMLELEPERLVEFYWVATAPRNPRGWSEFANPSDAGCERFSRRKIKEQLIPQSAHHFAQFAQRNPECGGRLRKTIAGAATSMLLLE
jgi:hypothetical protein